MAANRNRAKVTRKAKNKKSGSSSFNLVRSIANGNNVKAYKILEKALKDRVSKRIDDALSNI